jgi:hypothetical protein
MSVVMVMVVYMRTRLSGIISGMGAEFVIPVF